MNPGPAATRSRGTLAGAGRHGEPAAGTGGRPWLSIIVPVLDDAPALRASSGSLGGLRGPGCELLVVDGGSRDDSASVAARIASRVIEAPRGRASQMNAGARAAHGEILLFLHADTTVPAAGIGELERLFLAGNPGWGRFDVRLSGPHPALRLIEAAMNARSRLTGIATGDQGIFVSRALFDAVGGFPEIDLMEDVSLCAALRRRQRPRSLRSTVVTSSRRWERDGICRTVLLMWRLRLAFAFGADPGALARRYYRSSARSSPGRQ